MVYVMVVTADPDTRNHLKNIMAVLEGVEIEWIEAADAGLPLLKDKKFQLVISDETLPHMTGIQFLNQLVRINPMVNTALMSALTSEAFHEATEGLGVLGQLPLKPEASHINDLYARLKSILGLTTPNRR